MLLFSSSFSFDFFTSFVYFSFPFFTCHIFMGGTVREVYTKGHRTWNFFGGQYGTRRRLPVAPSGLSAQLWTSGPAVDWTKTRSVYVAPVQSTKRRATLTRGTRTGWVGHGWAETVWRTIPAVPCVTPASNPGPATEGTPNHVCWSFRRRPCASLLNFHLNPQRVRLDEVHSSFFCM